MEPVFSFRYVSEALPGETTWSRDTNDSDAGCWVASAWGVAAGALMRETSGFGMEHIIEETIYMPILQMAIAQCPVGSSHPPFAAKDDSDSEDTRPQPPPPLADPMAHRSAILHLTNDTPNLLVKMIPLADEYLYCRPCSANCLPHPQLIHYAFEHNVLFPSQVRQGREPIQVCGAIVEDLIFREPAEEAAEAEADPAAAEAEPDPAAAIFIRQVELLPRSSAAVGAGHREDELYIYCPPGTSVRVRAVWYANGKLAASARHQWLIR
jgi:hypothetical protein